MALMDIGLFQEVWMLPPLPVGDHKQVPGFYDHPGLLVLLNGWGNPFQILPSWEGDSRGFLLWKRLTAQLCSNYSIRKRQY